MKYLVAALFALGFLEINYGFYLWNDQSWKYICMGGFSIFYGWISELLERLR